MALSFAIIGPKNSQNTLDLCDAIAQTNNTSIIYDINSIFITSKNFKTWFG